MCELLRKSEIDLAVLTEGAVRDIPNGNPSRSVSNYVDSPLTWGVHIGSKTTLLKPEDLKDVPFAIRRLHSGGHLMAMSYARAQGRELNEQDFVVVHNLKRTLERILSRFFLNICEQGVKSSGNHPLDGVVEVDEAFVGGQESARGRGNKKKRLVVFAIERKGKGVSRLYGKVIPSAHAKHLGEFMDTTVAKTAKIRTDNWTGYAPLKTRFTELKQERSEPKGRNFKEMHRIIMGFKGWLRGIHHHARHLQAYVDEYSFRFNRSFMHEGVFQNLLDKMVAAGPHPFKTIVSG